MIHLNHSIATIVKIGATCAVAGTAYIQPYRPMVFVGRSMEPTYRSHSIVMTEPVSPDQIQHGQVVVIDMDGGPIVKRIAFAPGDKYMQTWMDGRWVDLIFARPTRKPSLVKMHWREYTVPKGMVYVLGDNQEVSYDSKQFGCIPISRIHRRLVDQRPFNLFANFQTQPAKQG